MKTTAQTTQNTTVTRTFVATKPGGYRGGAPTTGFNCHADPGPYLFSPPAYEKRSRPE